MRAIEFLRDYFNKDEYFIIAQKYPKIDDKVKHHHSMMNISNTSIEKQLGRFYYLNKDDNVDIYFSLNTYEKQNTFYPKRKEEFVASIKSFYFDIDKGDIEQKKQDIIKLIGEPTYVIESSKGKFQFIYKFNEAFIVKDENDIAHFKQLLKGLTYHFDVDKTFDTARIFRLANYMNKKPNNHNFIVTVTKFENYYTFEEFETVAKPYLLAENTIKPKKRKTSSKEKKTKKVSNTSNKFTKYKNINKVPNRKYQELLEKYQNDYSTADIAYARWLYFRKGIKNDKTIIEKIVQARGYEHIMHKHSNQIEYYFENIVKKCQL